MLRIEFWFSLTVSKVLCSNSPFQFMLTWFPKSLLEYLRNYRFTWHFYYHDRYFIAICCYWNNSSHCTQNLNLNFSNFGYHNQSIFYLIWSTMSPYFQFSFSKVYDRHESNGHGHIIQVWSWFHRIPIGRLRRLLTWLISVLSFKFIVFQSFTAQVWILLLAIGCNRDKFFTHRQVIRHLVTISRHLPSCSAIWCN